MATETAEGVEVKTVSHRVNAITYRKVKTFCSAHDIKLWMFIDEALKDKLIEYAEKIKEKVPA